MGGSESFFREPSRNMSRQPRRGFISAQQVVRKHRITFRFCCFTRWLLVLQCWRESLCESRCWFYIVTAPCNVRFFSLSRAVLLYSTLLMVGPRVLQYCGTNVSFQELVVLLFSLFSSSRVRIPCAYSSSAGKQRTTKDLLSLALSLYPAALSRFLKMHW